MGPIGKGLVLFDDPANTLDEGSWIKLRAYDVIGAVGENGDAPVADESDRLTGNSRLDL